MKRILGGKAAGVLLFVVIAALVVGGLGWATRAVLALEQQQLEQQALSEHAEKARLALWRLDSRLMARFAIEEGRPFSHYSAIFAPPTSFSNFGELLVAGTVLEPSPLLSTELEPWMLLHFQVDKEGWGSPQVLSPRLDKSLRSTEAGLELTNVTAARKALLERLAGELPASEFLATAEQHTGPAIIANRVLLAQLALQQDLSNEKFDQQSYSNLQGVREYAARSETQSKISNPENYGNLRVQRDLALLNSIRNGEEWFNTRPKETVPAPIAPGGPMSGAERPPTPLKRLTGSVAEVRMSPMRAVWLSMAAGEDRLMLLRLVKLDQRVLCQGTVLDGKQLAGLLTEEVQDLLPGASVHPVKSPSADQVAWYMTALPLRLDPGEPGVVPSAGWTGLRIGLVLSWLAAVVALGAVGLGGWGLVALSEGRMRFVSAVTHELRTPLTTLRLYLDMLLGGLVRDAAQQEEYLRTLHAETDRLSRLVTNVLDFARLENQAPQLVLAPLDVSAFLREVESAWRIRCEITGKELIVENGVAGGTMGEADLCLLAQVLGNLLDNACKYTVEAEDRRLWLRARQEGGRLVFEVEDRGAGIEASEQARVFDAFHRGQAAGEATGGVGLGLALARRWIELMGGRLALHIPGEGGACFRVELPLAAREMQSGR